MLTAVVKPLSLGLRRRIDLPQHLLPEFPAPIYLTTHPDLGDVSKGLLVTLANFHELFRDALNPKQLEGLRLLVTPFPQAQFNATEERRALTAHPFPLRGLTDSPPYLHDDRLLTLEDSAVAFLRAR
jgi:cytochrome c peroxidase